jgi:hypothetical protein
MPALVWALFRALAFRWERANGGHVAKIRGLRPVSRRRKRASIEDRFTLQRIDALNIVPKSQADRSNGSTIFR